MRFVMVYHSLLSCWNHGNAHFLRGVARELRDRGHEVAVLEPRRGWSFVHCLAEPGGPGAMEEVRRACAGIEVVRYDPAAFAPERLLRGADVVLVHEWSPTPVVRRIARHRRGRGDYALLFHDTHHRAVTDPGAIAAFDLDAFDGVLAFGEALRARYRVLGGPGRVYTWHEAADVRTFRPLPRGRPEGDLVWVGNWGDGERTAEIREFLVKPVRALGLRGKVYGVRWPEEGLEALAEAGIEYGGWLPNHRVPDVFARFRLTVHVPRRPYTRFLPGIPTIRPFEALACGIPLVSAAWPDVEGLFRSDRDLRFAADGAEMTRHLADLLADPEAAARQARSGLETVLSRHTCAHRVDELLRIVKEVRRPVAAEAASG
ncbi:glycosyltransferase [Myxococcota bacterium]|nr:glycosyltransferase [Myxococcota bacterium]